MARESVLRGENRVSRSECAASGAGANWRNSRAWVVCTAQGPAATRRCLSWLPGPLSPPTPALSCPSLFPACRRSPPPPACGRQGHRPEGFLKDTPGSSYAALGRGLLFLQSGNCKGSLTLGRSRLGSPSRARDRPQRSWLREGPT